MDRNYSWLIII